MGLLKIEVKSEKAGIKMTKVIHQTKNMNKEKYFVYLFTSSRQTTGENVYRQASMKNVRKSKVS